MDVFSAEDLEEHLSLLVGDAVLPERVLHHRRALHVVLHDVLEYRCQVRLVDAVKENFITCSDLKLSVTFHVKQPASFRESKMVDPSPKLRNNILPQLKE